MTAEMPEQLALPIPAEDDAIEQAFAQLDERLTAFTDAVTFAVDSLEGAYAEAATDVIAETAAEIQTSAEVFAQPETAEEAKEDVAVVDEAVASDEAIVEETLSEEVDEPSTTEESVAEEPVTENEIAAADIAEEADEPKRDVLGRIIKQKVEAAPVEEVEDTSEADARAEDEALLASLDEDTAKAIRVMRRVLPVKKRVAVLLEEYRAKQASPSLASEPTKKKGWFTRG